MKKTLLRKYEQEESGIRRGTTRSGLVFRKPNLELFDSLKALKRSHKRLFDKKSSYCIRERSIFSSRYKVIEATVRFSAQTSPKLILNDLKTVFLELKSTSYDNSPFSVIVTGNAIMASEENEKTSYSIFYGQDFSPQYFPNDVISDYAMSKVYKIRTLDDIKLLPLVFTPLDFSNIFEKIHQNTKIKVVDLLNLVYIFRQFVRR
jgi:hypothetical protein